MAESYNQIELRITKAIEALNTCEKPSLCAIAKEFDVPRERLRSRHNGLPPRTAVRGLHRRRLTADQELALRQYLLKMDSYGMPQRLHMVEKGANSILRQTVEPGEPQPFVSSHWAKRFLDRQQDLFKIKRKPLAVARANSHDLELLTGHFTRYLEVVQQFGIQPEDT